MSSEGQYFFENAFEEEFANQGKIPGGTFDPDYDGTETCTPLGIGIDFIKSMGGECGGGGYEKWNRRRGCMQWRDGPDGKDIKVLDQVLDCDLGGFSENETLKCRRPNYEVCPKVNGVPMGDMDKNDPKTAANAGLPNSVSWKVLKEAPMWCPNDDDGNCGNDGDCEYMKKLNSGQIMCKYGALDTLARVKSYRDEFKTINAPRVKKVMDAYCSRILKPKLYKTDEYQNDHKEEYEKLKALYGEPDETGEVAFPQCNLFKTASGETMAAHQCSVYHADGAAGTLCRSWLAEQYPPGPAKNNLMKDICTNSSVCRESARLNPPESCLCQPDDFDGDDETDPNAGRDPYCLPECSCYLRVYHKNYPGQNAKLYRNPAIPDRCWWVPCKSVSDEEVWKPTDITEDETPCPTLCQIINDFSELTANEIKVFNENNCETSEITSHTDDVPHDPNGDDADGADPYRPNTDKDKNRKDKDKEGDTNKKTSKDKKRMVLIVLVVAIIVSALGGLLLVNALRE